MFPSRKSTISPAYLHRLLKEYFANGFFRFEQNVAIVAANIPTFRPLFSKIFGIISSRSRGIGDAADYNYEHQFSTLKPASGSNSKNSGTRVKNSGTQSENQDEDEGSETNILPIQEDEQGSITKTTSVPVMNQPAVGESDVEEEPDYRSRLECLIAIKIENQMCTMDHGSASHRLSETSTSFQYAKALQECQYVCSHFPQNIEYMKGATLTRIDFNNAP